MPTRQSEAISSMGVPLVGRPSSRPKLLHCFDVDAHSSVASLTISLQPLEPVDTADQISRTPRCLRSVRTCIQNLAPLGLLKPHAEHVAVTVERDSQRQVAGAALHAAALADLQHQRVEEDHRVDVLKRPLRPGARRP
jgi:hypothetical protein